MAVRSNARIVRVLLAAVLLALSFTLAQPVAGAAADQGERHKLMLVFDSSGSMKQPDASGMSKIAAAKQALTRLVPELPEGSHVGLRVYGATVFGADNPKACTDSQQVVPVGPLDRKALTESIAGFEPYGETPIAYSLRQAAKDLGPDGRRTILLVSDGEERCDPDPCATARRISGLGIDLKIDVVGLRVSDQARNQLRCIADAGNGTFYEVDDVADLTTGLDRLATRAFRPFKVDGRPVEGTAEPESAPTLVPGQYVDTAPARDGVQHYRLRRTMPGSTLHVGVSARPPAGSTVAVLELGTRTLDGWSCGYGVGAETSFARTNPIVTASTTSFDRLGGGSGHGCDTSDELVLTIEQDGHGAPGVAADLGEAPIEIVVIEEPRVEASDGLPGPADDQPEWGRLPEPAAARTVVPGASFSDAPEVDEGTYRTSLFPGEVQFYRVQLEWGERLQAEVRAPRPGSKLRTLTDNPQGMELRLIGPARGGARVTGGLVASQGRVFLDDDEAARARTMSVDVRYANREGCCRAQYAASIPGDYYVAVSLGNDIDGQSYLLPLEVQLGIRGTAGAGAPPYAGGARLLGPGVQNVRLEPARADRTERRAKQDEGGTGAPVFGGGLDARLLAAGIVATLGAVVVGVMVFLRRRHPGTRRARR